VATVADTASPTYRADQTASGDVAITRGRVRLAARLSFPRGDPPFPCVIFVHGLASSKDSPRNTVIATHLLAAGLATLLFDLSGHGESAADPRDGEEAYIQDLEAVFRWATRQPEVDSYRIGVAGSSLGGVIAVRAVCRHLIRPAAMVLRAPPVEPHDFVQLSVPSLAVIGSADPLLPGVRAAAGQSEAVTLCIIQGAGHLFEEPGTLQVALEKTVLWFQAQLISRKQDVSECPESGAGEP
jgi:alpha-beta hydrolase superfamily lysophospholipase